MRLTVRKLWISDEVKKALQHRLSREQPGSKHGHITRDGDWLTLTVEKALTVKNFDPVSKTDTEQEIRMLRPVIFTATSAGALMLHGGATGLKHVDDLLQSLSVDAALGDQTLAAEMDKWFKLTEPIVSLSRMYTMLDTDHGVRFVERITVSELDVDMGAITRAVVHVDDDGAGKAAKSVKADEERIYAFAARITDPAGATVAVDRGGSISVRVPAKVQNAVELTASLARKVAESIATA